MRSRLRGVRVQFILATAFTAVAASVGCNALLDFDAFSVTNANGGDDGGNDGGEGGLDAGGCIDPTGFDGRGCYRCAPTTNDQLLSACTTSRFEPFDNAARIVGFDPANPKPPLVDGGPLPPMFDAGTSGPTADAGPVDVCPFDTAPHPVIVLGATGFPMDTIAKAMGTEATIFYAETSSCPGVASIITNSPKATGKIKVFDNATGAARDCTFPDDGNGGTESFSADITLSALFTESCSGQSGLPTNVQLPGGTQDLLGPINPVMFTVTKGTTSKERVISAEAAWKVFGFGSASGVAPWTDENFIFKRRPGSANQETVALTLGMPSSALRGVDSNGSSNMLKALQASADPARTIGISSSEIVDTNRDVLRALAYQHYGQPVGFYPDSDPATLDRRNVRDGHYFMWIPLHVFVRTNGSGDPVAAENTVLDALSSRADRDATTKKLAFVMVNRQEAPVKTVDLFGALKKVGNVPQCAMRVTRQKEGAPLSPFKPSAACDCAFEAAAPGNTLPECKPCRDATECNAERPTCSFGYCE